MDNMNVHKSVGLNKHPALANPGTEEKPFHPSDRSRVLACVLILPSDAEPIVSLLKSLAAPSSSALPFPLPFDGDADFPKRTEDPWLEHAEAAEYLGISKSTLYRYVSHQRVECRKIAGRLEYRQSVLERLKQEHIRPARLSLRSSAIISSTLNSGK